MPDSMLLRPESGVVGFHSFREPLRDSIIGWALDPDQPIKLRLQAGEGGAGKTRLLIEVCKRLRSAPATAMLPIIMLTAKAEESDTIIGLELGADDYVTKPFSPKTLVARIKALFRRLERKPDDSPAQYRYGNLVMDLARHEVTVKKMEVPLTAKEFGLLEHLLRNPGRVLTRDILLNTVWGYDYYGTTRTVDVHIRRLKQKLPSLNEAIISVKSLGYKLKERES